MNMLSPIKTNAVMAYNGDPEWRQVTVGMSADVHAWLEREAKYRKLSRSELLRSLLLEAYVRACW